ncbi:unnamed protein product [Calypogeia fissa]
MSSSSGAGSIQLRPAFSYCVQQVRKYDYEHYLPLLHLPASIRRAAFAIRAFNVETAKAGDTARDPNLAVMRLIWWRDAVEGMYKKAPVEHPVAKALAAVIDDHRLSKRWFTRLIEARVSDLEMTTAPVSVEEVERYAESTASALLYLTLEAAGVLNTAADHAASHIGKAEGLALLVRATPVHGAKRRTYIPVDIAAKFGLSQEEIYRGQNAESLADAVHEMASVANAHLGKARALSSSVPKEAAPVLLPAVSAGSLLQSLERYNFNVFDPMISRGVCGVSPLWMQLQLKWHAYRGTY